MTNDNPYGVSAFLAQGDAVGLLVLLILGAMSVATWYLIVTKSVSNRRMSKRVQLFMAHFWGAPSIDTIATELARQSPEEPFGRVAAQAMEARQHYRRSMSAGLVDAGGQGEFLTRSIRRAIIREAGALEFGLSVLASIGSTAPFVGLFGTVWGIYHALIGIGASGAATLDAVAGPVGEALIMTAAGLFVAIPAVLAHNAFARGNRTVLAELDGFAHDLHAFLTTGAKLDSGGFVDPTKRMDVRATVAKAA